jgi:hypothetical protein
MHLHLALLGRSQLFKPVIPQIKWAAIHKNLPSSGSVKTTEPRT